MWKHVGGGSQQQTGWAVVSTTNPRPLGWLLAPPGGSLVLQPGRRGKMGTERRSPAPRPVCRSLLPPRSSTAELSTP